MAKKTIDDLIANQTPKAMMQAIDSNFTENYTAITANTVKLATIENNAESNNLSDAQAIDLTDGSTTTLHYHAADRLRSAHTGTQLASTISDLATAISTNAAVALNTAKKTNVSTHLAEGTTTTTTVTITSSDGDDAILYAASPTRAGLMTSADKIKLSTASASYTAPWA